MKSRFLFVSAVLSLLTGISSSALAATEVTGKVIIAGTYGSGQLFVILDTHIAEPGCSGNRFDVAANHPQIKNWLAVAMTSFSTGASVTVRVNGCMNTAWSTMSQGTDTYFFLVK